MLFLTHLLFSFLLSLALHHYFDISPYAYFPLFVISGLLADIDEASSFIGRRVKIIGFLAKHRGAFHSFALPFLTASGIYFLLGFSYAAAFFIGYSSHLLLDMLNYQGIMPFYPFSEYRTKGFMKSGGALEWLLRIGLAALCLGLVLRGVF